MQRRIVIGDVHGHYDSLVALLEAISPGYSDQVYLLGDLVDRGPKSYQVVDLVINNKYNCILGNHEHMIVEILLHRKGNHPALQTWLSSGGNNTLRSYGRQGVSLDHLDWMNQLPTFIDLDDIWLSHAGLDPNLPLEKQGIMQLCWVREEFHSSPRPYFPDKTIITGHTITFTFPGVEPGKLVVGPGWMNIDTGAYHPKSGWLTGVDLTNSLVYQVNSFSHAKRVMFLEDAITQVNPADCWNRRGVQVSPSYVAAG